MGKSPPQDCRELCDLFNGGQVVEARHQRILQGGRNCHRRQQASQHVTLARFLQQVRFKHRLCQFLNKKRNAVGFGQDVVQHGFGQGFPAGQFVDDAQAFLAAQTIEAQFREVVMPSPWRYELGPGGQDSHYR